MRRALLTTLLLGLAAPSAAEFYRWTDAEGREHFTQDVRRVPPEHRAESIRAARSPRGSPRVQTYEEPPRPARAAPTAAEPAGAQRAYRVRVQRAGPSMMVQARLNGSVTAPFLIDTGASDVLIPQSVADRLGLHVGPDTRTKRYSTANGIVEHPVVTLRSVDLGGAVVKEVPASISPNMSFGLLGLSYFNHFTVNVDAAAGVVTLVPNRLAESGRIRGGRSEAQWRSEYRSLRARIERTRHEYEDKPESRTRERNRLERQLAELERHVEKLDEEANRARVPATWRR
jgi:aspartyl protease family protein